MRSLGVSVGARAVHAVILNRGLIEWSRSQLIGDGDDTQGAISSLLLEAETALPNAVRVALARDLVQIRPLAASEAVSSDVDSRKLFRRNGSPLAVSTERAGHDRMLAAAVSESLLEEVELALEQHRRPLRHVYIGSECAVNALRHAKSTARLSLTLQLGENTEVINIVKGRVVGSRLSRADGPAAPVEWSPALAVLGDDSADYAMAFGAAATHGRWKFEPPRAQRSRIRRDRQWLKISVTGLVLSVMLAFAAFKWRLGEDRARLTAQREQMAGGVSRFAHKQRHEVQLRAAVEYANSFARNGMQPSKLLVTLGEVLPADVVAESVELDHRGQVRLTANGASALRTLAELDQVPVFRSPRLSGVSSVAAVGGERFTIELAWVKP